MKKQYWILFSPLFLAFLCCIQGCSVNRARIDDSLQKFFDDNKVEGCFTMMNNADGKVTVYNMELDTSRFLPASTFKIVNSLIGLEIGRITNENMVIPWNGIKSWNEDWNKDLTMMQAFKASSLPYYQEVARRIGKDTMQTWLDSLQYGNAMIGNHVDSFWINNTLKVSPDEQLGLVKRLYFDQLPFQKRTQEIVRQAMKQEDNTLYALSYKTGWGFDENKASVGWVVGWIEENKHPYFFVTLVKSKDPNIDMRSVRMNITKGILEHLGFMKGKK